MRFSAACAASVSLLAGTAGAHYDISPYLIGGQLLTGGLTHSGQVTPPPIWVYGYDFGDEPLDPYNSADPGVNQLPGVGGLPAGAALYYDIRNSLIFWDGTGGVAWTSPPGDGYLELTVGAATRKLTGTSGPQAGSLIQSVLSDGSLHKHLLTSLYGAAGSSNVPGYPGYVQPPAGCYSFSLTLKLVHAGVLYGSDPIRVVFNNGLNEAAHDAAMQSVVVVHSTWQGAAGGNWSDAGNWSAGVPHGKGATARLTSGAATVVTADGPRTIGRLFLGGADHSIQGSAITFDNTDVVTPVGAPITVSSHAQTIGANVTTVAASDLTIDVAGGASLLLGGGIGNLAGKAISKSGEGVLSIAEVQAHGAGASLLVTAGTVNLDTDAGVPAVAGTAALANLGVSITGGQLRLGANQTLASMSSQVSGGIDLAGRQVMAYAAGDEAAMNAAVGDGRLIDSTAGAHASASIGVAGRPDAHGEEMVLIRLTRLGDANCDGTVNFGDLLRLSQNYNTSGRTWDQGDFNYDTQVNFADLLRLSQNYNQSFASPIAVPEPSALGLLVAGGGLLARRRGRQ